MSISRPSTELASSIRFQATDDAISLSVNAAVQGRLTSQSSPKRSDVTCTRVMTTTAGNAGVFSEQLSEGGGDAVTLATRPGDDQPALRERRDCRPSDSNRGTHPVHDHRSAKRRREINAHCVRRCERQPHSVRTDRQGSRCRPNSILVVQPSTGFWLESVAFAGSFKMAFHGTVDSVRNGGGSERSRSHLADIARRMAQSKRPPRPDPGRRGGDPWFSREYGRSPEKAQ